MPLPCIHETLQYEQRRFVFTDRGPLHRYLAAHPAAAERLREVLGMNELDVCADFSVDEDQVLLHRVHPAGENDELASMAAWHALFPGERPPLNARWIDGRYKITRDHVMLSDVWLLDAWRSRTYYIGPWQAKDAPLAERDLMDWPLWAKFLFLPVLMVLLPVGLGHVLVKDMKAHRYGGGWLFLYIPMFTLMVPVYFFFPRMLRRFPRRLTRPFLQHQELVEKLDRV